MKLHKLQEVYLLCGLPGSGKTTYASKLMRSSVFIRFSIDEAMYQKHGRYNVDYPHTQYKDIERLVYGELDRELIKVISEGHSVILDYGFWRRHEREKYKTLLDSMGVDWHLLYFKETRATLQQRLQQRNKTTGPNALYVDDDLFERMHQKFEEPVNEGEEVIMTVLPDDDQTKPNLYQSNQE